MQWRCTVLAAILFWPIGVQADQWEVCPSEGIQTFLGLDDTSAPTQVRDGRAQALQNVLLDVSQGLTKRYGIKVVGNTCDIADEAFPPITGLYYTKFSNGTEWIVRTCSSRFQYLNGSVWTGIGSPTITGGANNQFVWTTALDNIIGTNDVDAPFQFDGGIAKNVSFSGLTNAITQAKTVAFFKNYLLFFNITEGGTDRPTRFRWSDVGTIGTWTNANFIDIGALGGQEINAVGELYDNLYVFLTDSIYKISLVGGADTWQVSKVTDDIGSIAKNSVQSIILSNAQSGLVFLDRDKRIYFFNGIYAQDISILLTQTMKGLRGSRLQYAVSADTNTDYWLCVNNVDGTMNDLCLDLQYQIGEWTKHTKVQANTMASVLDSNSIPQVYFGNYHGLTYQLNDSTKRADVDFLEQANATDVAFTSTVDSVSRFTTATASGLQVLYDDVLNLTTGALVGAPILLVDGVGKNQTGIVVDNTITGVVVASDFLTTPTTTTKFEVGGIDAFYTTKWYDMKHPALLKHFGEVDFWADSDVTSTISLSYATDYNSDITTLNLELTPSTTNATWGDTIVGAPLYGSVDSVMRIGKLESQGRFLRLKWADDDPNEIFHLYGWNCLYQAGELN